MVTQSLLTSQRAIDQSIRPTSDGDSGWCPESNKRRTSVGHESNKSRTRVEQESNKSRTRAEASGREGKEGRREGGKEERRNGGKESARGASGRGRGRALGVTTVSRPCHDRHTAQHANRTPTAARRSSPMARGVCPAASSHESRVVTSRHESSRIVTNRHESPRVVTSRHESRVTSHDDGTHARRGASSACPPPHPATQPPIPPSLGDSPREPRLTVPRVR